MGLEEDIENVNREARILTLQLNNVARMYEESIPADKFGIEIVSRDYNFSVETDLAYRRLSFVLYPQKHFRPEEISKIYMISNEYYDALSPLLSQREDVVQRQSALYSLLYEKARFRQLLERKNDTAILVVGHFGHDYGIRHNRFTDESDECSRLFLGWFSKHGAKRLGKDAGMPVYYCKNPSQLLKPGKLLLRFAKVLQAKYDEENPDVARHREKVNRLLGKMVR